MKTKVLGLIAVLMGFIISFSACTGDTTDAAKPAQSSVVDSCKKKRSPFFSCPFGGDLYLLCESRSGKLLFLTQQKQTLSSILFSAPFEDYFYSNYHRFKITQNTVSFSNNIKKYEVFEYYDEESKPALIEYGLTITQVDGEPQSIYCDNGAVSHIYQLEDKLSK